MENVNISNMIYETTTKEKVNYNHKRYITSPYAIGSNETGQLFDFLSNLNFEDTGFTWDGVYCFLTFRSDNDGTFLFDGVLRGNNTKGVIEILRNDHVSGTLWLTNYNGDINYSVYLGTNEPN